MLSFISCKQTKQTIMKQIISTHKHKWFLQHDIGIRLLKSYNKRPKANFQGNNNVQK
jgi:hypothetical protein